MSENILENDVLIVTRFAGGTASRAGTRRRGVCYQINDLQGNKNEWVELTASEALRLAAAILRDQGVTSAARQAESVAATIDKAKP